MKEEAWGEKSRVADGFSGEKLGVLLVLLEKTSSANMVRIDHGLKKRSMGFLTKRHHYRALIFPLA